MNIENPHDKFFKDIFSDKKRAIELIKEVVPKDIDNILNYKSIENRETEFIDKEMKKFHSDLLFSIKTIDNRDMQIYLLFEHKSYADKNINIQILSYFDKNIFKNEKAYTGNPNYILSRKAEMEYSRDVY
jgi:predicted transposase/invertase (TIGR01784 family)